MFVSERELHPCPVSQEEEGKEEEELRGKGLRKSECPSSLSLSFAPHVYEKSLSSESVHTRIYPREDC